MQFFEELKRRNVIRVGAAYVVAAWLIIQVVETLFPIYELPDSAVRFVVTALAVGFLPAMFLAWALEVTPEGLKWEKNVDRTRSITGQTGKKLDRIIIIVLAVAVGFFAFDKFVMSESREAEIAESAREEGRAEARRATFYQSIAVLPFVNRSNRDDDVYFVDGIHDDILTQLAHIDALAVTSRTSVEQYRGTTETIKAIAEQLGVRTILEGGVQRAGDRVRINMQLIDAATDDHLWAETYVRELTAANIFAVQADIAASVANALQATLRPDEESALAEIPTESMAAYDYYLLGRHHSRKRTKESLELARDFFLQAIEQDPDYVPALSGLADSYTLLVSYGTMRGSDAFPLAQEAIDRAMALDDSVSEVWASQGILHQSQHQYGASESVLKRALELDPKNSQAWIWYATTLRLSGRYVESFEASKKGYELEPMSIPGNWRMVRHYNEYGDFARERQHLERIAQADAGRRKGIEVEIARSYLHGGDLARATEAFRTILASTPRDIASLDLLGRAYLAQGDLREAERWFDQAAAIGTYYRGHYRFYYARQDFAGAILVLENALQLFAPRRPDPLLYELFNAHYLAGDTAGARSYLTELIDVYQGRYEVSAQNISQLEGLNVASFWINFGDEAAGEPQRGIELVAEIRDNFLKLHAEGFRNPVLFAHLAAAEGLLGNLDAAIGYLDTAVDQGYRNTDVELEQHLFDPLRDTEGFAAVAERIAGLVAQERARLADVDLAPYSPPEERKPVVVARAITERYVGYYSDGNAISHLYFGPDGQFLVKLAQQPPVPVFMLSDVAWYTPEAPNQYGEFVMDENGVVTHVLWYAGSQTYMVKKIADPPAPVQLPRDVLARMEGTYANDRLEGMDAPRTAADTWVAIIYVDDNGTPWIDYDDQPRLELAAVSESVLRIIGFDGVLTFQIDPESDRATGFLMKGDFGSSVFVRQEENVLQDML